MSEKTPRIRPHEHTRRPLTGYEQAKLGQLSFLPVHREYASPVGDALPVLDRDLAEVMEVLDNAPDAA